MTLSEQVAQKEFAIIRKQLEMIQEKLDNAKNKPFFIQLNNLESIARNANKAIKIIKGL
jgi:hypothetical protein